MKCVSACKQRLYRYKGNNKNGLMNPPTVHWQASRRLQMGVDSTNLTAIVAYNPTPAAEVSLRHIALHFVIITIGRAPLIRCLESFGPQLEAQDYITLQFDGDDLHDVGPKARQMLAQYRCHSEVLVEETTDHTMGNTLRHKHRDKRGHGDFLIYFDDDNYFLPGAIDIIRTAVRLDTDALYMFKMQTPSGELLRWVDPNVNWRNTDTGGGVSPVQYAHLLTSWTNPDRHNADNRFFVDLSNIVPRTVFVDAVTYVYTGVHYGKDVETSKGT